MADRTLPIWDEMSDLDKGAALLHAAKAENEGDDYAREEYPVEYFDHPALLALDTAAACVHALKVTGGAEDVFDQLGVVEWDRLYELALAADVERIRARHRGANSDA